MGEIATAVASRWHSKRCPKWHIGKLSPQQQKLGKWSFFPLAIYFFLEGMAHVHIRITDDHVSSLLLTVASVIVQCTCSLLG